MPAATGESHMFFPLLSLLAWHLPELVEKPVVASSVVFAFECRFSNSAYKRLFPCICYRSEWFRAFAGTGVDEAKLSVPKPSQHAPQPVPSEFVETRFSWCR